MENEDVKCNICGGNLVPSECENCYGTGIDEDEECFVCNGTGVLFDCIACLSNRTP